MTISAYLLGTFLSEKDSERDKKLFPKNCVEQKKQITRVEILLTLHESVADALNKLVRNAIGGLEYTTLDKK